MTVVCACVLAGSAGWGQGPAPARIYWGDEVPKAWNGTWPAPLLTVPERTRFARTTSTLELHEFVNTLKWRSDRLHVFPVFTTATGLLDEYLKRLGVDERPVVFPVFKYRRIVP